MKKVIAFGTFDRFHAGHESYLRQAKFLGSSLIVVIARDQTVKRIKGRLPNDNEKERKAAVKAHGAADKVILGELSDKYAVIRKHKPDIIALGYDQFAFTYRLKKFLIDRGLNSKIIRMKPYKPAVYKTSILRNSLGLNNEISTYAAFKEQ